MEIIICGGTIINAYGRKESDVRINDGVITETGSGLETATAQKVIDATGLFVLPGAIDVHTHLQMKMGDTFSADGYMSGTKAAACGGVTTVFDYTLQENGRSLLDEIREREALAVDAACVDYAFHGGMSRVNFDTLNGIPELVRAGFPSIKAYMTYDFGLNDKELFRLFKASAASGALVTVHAESDAIVSVNREEFRAAGRGDVWHHYLSRPEIAEEEADIRAVMLAEAAGAPVYIVHLANAGGKEFLTQWKKRRAADLRTVPVYVETCPHYLEFTNEVYKKPDGIRYICSPPIKGEESRKALWEGIADGTVDVIATDHCPSQSFEKDRGRDDFTLAPNGLMGIENMYPYMLDAAGEYETARKQGSKSKMASEISRKQGTDAMKTSENDDKGTGLTYERAVELCSYNPARIFGCENKGEIAPGKDADIVLYDPEKEFTITASGMHSDIDYTIYEGRKLKGYPVMTLSRGMIVYEDGVFKGEAGYGRLVRRNAPAAFRPV